MNERTNRIVNKVLNDKTNIDKTLHKIGSGGTNKVTSSIELKTIEGLPKTENNVPVGIKVPIVPKRACPLTLESNSPNLSVEVREFTLSKEDPVAVGR